MIDIYIFVLYNILLAVFITLFLLLRKRHHAMILSVAQLIIDKGILVERLEQAELAASKEVNDGFIKFLSQSREEAFKYIENIQLATQNYLKAINSNDNEAIEIARMELFSYLPDNIEDENQNKQ